MDNPQPPIPYAVPIGTQTTPISTNTTYYIQPLTISVMCRSCGVIFQRPTHMQPTSDQYFRCSSCSGLTKKRFMYSMCSIQ